MMRKLIRAPSRRESAVGIVGGDATSAVSSLVIYRVKASCPLFSSEVYADEMLFRGYQDFKIDIYLQVLFRKQNAYSLGIEIR